MNGWAAFEQTIGADMDHTSTQKIDAAAEHAGRVFLERVEGRYDVVETLVFGSHARGDHAADSDVDIAVILEDPAGQRWTAAADMAGIAFDVMQETGILLDPLPLWQSELQDPESFSNPALIHIIRREGRRL